MAKVGAPVTKWTDEHFEKVNQEIREYTDRKDFPSIAGFSYEYNYNRQELYKHPELNDSIKMLLAKKEAMLEERALMNQANPTMAIFSLKQLGWSDKQQIEQTVTETESKELATMIKKKIEGMESDQLKELDSMVDPASKEKDV